MLEFLNYLVLACVDSAGGVVRKGINLMEVPELYRCTFFVFIGLLIVAELIIWLSMRRAKASYLDRLELYPIVFPPNMTETHKRLLFVDDHTKRYLREIWLALRFLEFVLVPVLTLLFSYVYSFINTPVDYNVQTWGAAGDFFGGMLNPILGFASFTALLYTIKLQTKELGLTRDELTKSSYALENQLDIQRIQKFETTFFKLFDTSEKQFKTIEKESFQVKSMKVSLGGRLSTNAVLHEENAQIDFDEFTTYLAIDSEFGFDHETQLWDISLSEEYFKNKQLDGKNIFIKLKDFSEALNMYEEYSLKFIDFYLHLYLYVEQNSSDRKLNKVYFNLLKSLLDERFALLILLHVSIVTNLPKRVIVEKHALLECLGINGATGMINMGSICVDDLPLDRSAYGSNIGYLNYKLQ